MGWDLVLRWIFDGEWFGVSRPGVTPVGTALFREVSTGILEQLKGGSNNTPADLREHARRETPAGKFHDLC